jgi:AraC-like DNA-binding protein
MIQCGSVAFTNPDEYQAAIAALGVSTRLVLTGSTDFKARLTWLRLRHLLLVSARESVPRIAYLSLPPARAFVSFPVEKKHSIIWGGLELRLGDIAFHARGERTHHRTNQPNRWGMISLPYTQLGFYSKVLTGTRLGLPPLGQAIRPPASAAALLIERHLSACRLAETKPEMIACEEVERAMEQEFIHALINCLTVDHACSKRQVRRDEEDVLLRFEDALTDDDVRRRPSTSELSAAIGVTERTLRACCEKLLGLSPSRYLQLRQRQVRLGLERRAGVAMRPVARLLQTRLRDTIRLR